MNYPSLRHVTDAELDARAAIASWPLHNNLLSKALSYAPLPQYSKLIAVEAYRQEMCWRGFIDLYDWLEHVAPELASLAYLPSLTGCNREHERDEHVRTLFEANVRPIDMPISALFYEILHIRRDLEPPPPGQCLLSLMTPQGRIWFSEYPSATFVEQLPLHAKSTVLSLPLMLSWRLGSSNASRRLVSQLRCRDVLLICQEKFDITSAGKTVGYFSINEGGEVSMQVGCLNQTGMQGSIDGEVDISGSTNAESHITSAIADIPLRLDFILQRRMTTVAQLDAMYHGQVLQLDPQAERQVEITVNGMRIAMGELVELNGRLGVELQDISLGHYQDEKRSV